jgi:hypothetical protein
MLLHELALTLTTEECLQLFMGKALRDEAD